MGRINNKVSLPRAWFEALRAPLESDKTQKRFTICRLLGIQQQLQCCCCSGGENKLNLRLLRGLGHPASALTLYSWWKDKINQCCGKTRGKYLCRLFLKNRNIFIDKINPWLILKKIKFGILKRPIFTVFRSQRTQSEQVAKTTRCCDMTRHCDVKGVVTQVRPLLPSMTITMTMTSWSTVTIVDSNLCRWGENTRTFDPWLFPSGRDTRD